MKEACEWPFMFVPMNPLYHSSFSLCCALSSMGGHRCFLCMVTTTMRLKGLEMGQVLQPLTLTCSWSAQATSLSESHHYRILSAPGFQELIPRWPDWARGGKNLSVIRAGYCASLFLYSISMTSKILCLLSTLLCVLFLRSDVS